MVPGHKAAIRVSASNQRTTPEIFGTVTRVSADVSKDQQTGISFYTIRVGVTPDELARLGNLRIVAGMQAEVFIQTNERTPLQYLIKPLKDQFARAFRES